MKYIQVHTLIVKTREDWILSVDEEELTSSTPTKEDVILELIDYGILEEVE